MKKLINKYGKSVFIIIVFVLSAITLYQLRYDFIGIKLINPIYLLWVFLLIIMFLVVNGLMMKTILRSFGINLLILESTALSITNSLGNLITPFRGGVVSNAIYLKTKYKLNISNYIAILSATYVIIFWVNSVVGLIACICLKYYSNIFSWPIFLLFLGVVVFLGCVLLFSPRVKKVNFPFVSKVIYVINQWNLISKNRRVVLAMICYNLLNIVLMIFTCYFEFMVIGINIPLMRLVVLSVFSIFSLLLSFTPAGLGIKEAFSAYSGVAVGIPVSQVIVVSILDRLMNIAAVLLLSLPSSYLLLKRKN